MMNYDEKIQQTAYELIKEDYIKRVKIEVELYDGINISLETTKPNKEIK